MDAFRRTAMAAWTAALLAVTLVHSAQGQERASEPKGVVVLQATAEPPLATVDGCRHGADEPPRERSRRDAALSLVDEVLAAQKVFRAQTGRYGQLAELEDVPFVPSGWRLQHAVNGPSFMVSVKDETDRCGYALYSDHRGVIYSAAPVEGPRK